MTKKDFKAIADAIYTAKDIHAGKSRETAERIAGDIANHCKDSNPLFDREKFMEASGF